VVKIITCESPWIFPLFGLATSQNRSWAFVFLVVGEVAMIVTIELDPAVEQLIEDLRMKHIDANLIIQEELNQLLPPYIEDIGRGVYGEVVK